MKGPARTKNARRETAKTRQKVGTHARVARSPLHVSLVLPQEAREESFSCRGVRQGDVNAPRKPSQGSFVQLLGRGGIEIDCTGKSTGDDAR